MSSTSSAPVAPALSWRPGPQLPAFSGAALLSSAQQVRASMAVIRRSDDGAVGIGIDGHLSSAVPSKAGFDLIGQLPPLYPEWLGDRGFCEAHRLRFPYVAGAMANGIASVAMVEAIAEQGGLAFFGAAGLSAARVEASIVELNARLQRSGKSWGVNLIHSPSEPALELALAEMFLRHGVRNVEASAYMALTPAIVYYAAKGLHTDPSGRILRLNRVIAKVSREEVARRFLLPPPLAMLDSLREQGRLSELEIKLAAQISIAEDITVESDSGGHTDNRPLAALLPSVAVLREEIRRQQGYSMPIRIGAAGGLGTPSAVAAAFAMGAAYVQTGSVNQACVESGLHASGRAMLAQAGMADVTMAPAADMFEMGVDVQVLKRGSLFATRARKLYELYRSFPSLAAIPAEEREKVERTQLRASFDEAWASTREFWQQRDPAQVERAERDPKHQMALVFRAYLGLSSRWAIDGIDARSSDYQIWCGPAMGAFNRWVTGSFLEAPEQRTVGQVMLNLMEGAAVVTRAQQLRSFGVAMPETGFDFRPRPLC
ncbi:PfaD family polyunsaturated fatty acid/polyketide biosynthesis protein [Pseudomarimonas arenosa]|uniref:PfaD family polyunsaturated fatty acid/polyketide biosynthesis protein n=1 Tax=Pseudomarimonas arenosa TaxID=2774145 RepID=A0AAW3ZH72_9GAMM|nr:PfaD family polyunsaturated fatty acid/polyketide biosynthesis protein [Pseudomarimonas arenosa]MBD8525373.1 PfaD family polyunsaturated fatty acid/polyketide biosynthesis protein [Pseudomarimonas arenosa]